MLAASTASAPPRVTPSAKSSSEPTPPEAITGTGTASLTARVSFRSNPDLVPSRSMLVSRISPAPRRAISAAHCTASRPVFLRPPWLYTSQPGPAARPSAPMRCSSSAVRRLASMATTMHCAPYLSEAALITSGLAMAAELKLVLSAPALSRRRTSSTVRTPPPTVSGMKTWLATDSMMGRIRSRPSLVAVMSRKVSSSAPWAL